MVLPSIAMTRRWSTMWVRVHIQAERIASSLAASSGAKARRIAVSDGPRLRPEPSAARRSGSASATHCPIAANDFAPVSTAATATARIPGRPCRIPRRLRGSGSVASSSNNTDADDSRTGCGQAGAVREDVIDGVVLGLVVGFSTAIQVPRTTSVTHATPRMPPQSALDPDNAWNRKAEHKRFESWMPAPFRVPWTGLAPAEREAVLEFLSTTEKALE